jgi:hypothetical protein
MSFSNTSNPRNQAELVEKYMAEHGGPTIVEEELDAVGIAKMHEKTPESMVEYLSTLLKSRRSITRIKWMIFTPDQDEDTEFQARPVKWSGIENLVSQTRTEIATSLIAVFGQDSKVVGVEWEIGGDRVTAYLSEEDRSGEMEGHFWVEHDTSR